MSVLAQNLSEDVILFHVLFEG